MIRSILAAERHFACPRRHLIGSHQRIGAPRFLVSQANNQKQMKAMQLVLDHVEREIEAVTAEETKLDHEDEALSAPGEIRRPDDGSWPEIHPIVPPGKNAKDYGESMFHPNSAKHSIPYLMNLVSAALSLLSLSSLFLFSLSPFSLFLLSLFSVSRSVVYGIPICVYNV